MEKVSWITAVSLLSIATLLAIVLSFVYKNNTYVAKRVMSDTVASFLYKMTHDFKTVAEEHNLHYVV